MKGEVGSKAPMRRGLLSAVACALLAACGGDEPQEPTQPASPAGGTATAGGVVTGDGSDLCLETSDMPSGYLPLTGSDNTSNASDHVFEGEEPEVQDAKDTLVASWLTLPASGADPLEDFTATCSVYLFDTADIDDIYTWYAGGYASRSLPPPVEAEVPAGAPGEDPHLFHYPPTQFTRTESFNYVFRVGNVIANVGADGPGGSITADDVVALAQIVNNRIAAAGS